MMKLQGHMARKQQRQNLRRETSEKAVDNPDEKIMENWIRVIVAEMAMVCLQIYLKVEMVESEMII